MTKASTPVDMSSTEDAWRAAIASSTSVLRGSDVLFLAAEAAGWTLSAVEVSAGETVTLLGHGRVWLSREADLAVGPNVSLWHCIGDGPIARSTGNTQTFIATRSGTLRFIVKPPGEWADREGHFLEDYPHGGATGGLLVAVLVWSDHAGRSLGHFARNDTSGVAAAELRRRSTEQPMPRGWQPHWRVGATGMFSERAAQDGQSCIACHCDNDAAILTYPVDIPLDEDTRFAWSWHVDRLPSTVAEDSLTTHDYLSVALEFDNGQDLTWLWSSTLEEGTAFRCPIAWWDQHETHLVCRSGVRDLGRWIDEEVPVFEDYARAVGGTMPRRVVGVWLIALSPFQRSVGSAEFRNLRLSSIRHSLWVGP
jgi:hypothetical protein